MTDAVNANGRRISYRAPARRRTRSPRPSVRSSARLSVTEPTAAAALVASGSRPDAAATGTDPTAPTDSGAARRLRDRGEDRRRGDQLVDLAVLLEDGLEERQLESRLHVIGHRARGDVLARAAQHERVEQFVGDEVARGRVVLGPPGRRDPVAKLRVEAGPVQRDVGQDRHHVDHERLALRPVERLAPGLVDERQQVPRHSRSRADRGPRPRPTRAGARGCRAATGWIRPGAPGTRPPSGRRARRTPSDTRRSRSGSGGSAGTSAGSAAGPVWPRAGARPPTAREAGPSPPRRARSRHRARRGCPSASAAAAARSRARARTGPAGSRRGPSPSSPARPDAG